MKKLWYQLFKIYIQTGLFFYTKKIKISGRENIPKKGAVLFAVNHPNGLLDPLLVTTNTPRVTHYLVRAAIFKKPLVKKFLATLNLMPIYRIRDGVKELSKNTEIFNNCYEILNNQSALMIFPEGSHNRKRTIRNLSKGFTRILFGAMDKYPNLPIHIIPVGVTYQNASQYPSKVAIHYGTPILANAFYNKEALNSSIKNIKLEVSNQLEKLSVHIPFDDNYNTIFNQLNDHQVDFTEVEAVNNMVISNTFQKFRKPFNFGILFKFLFVLNSLIPWVLWKLIAKKIDEIEFLDTFRFGIGISLFPIFYVIQTLIVNNFYGSKYALLYFGVTLIIALLTSKLSSTPAE